MGFLEKLKMGRWKPYIFVGVFNDSWPIFGHFGPKWAQCLKTFQSDCVFKGVLGGKYWKSSPKMTKKRQCRAGFERAAMTISGAQK